MNNVILSTAAIDDLIDDIANAVVSRIVDWKVEGTPLLSNSGSSDLMNIQQAAEFTGLAVTSIYLKSSQGTIPCTKKGKRLYFSKSELTEWINQGHKKGLKQ